MVSNGDNFNLSALHWDALKCLIVAHWLGKMVGMKKTYQLPIRMEEDYHAKLKSVAKTKRVKKTWLAREYIFQGIDRDYVPDDAEKMGGKQKKRKTERKK